jgi:hypothetical protein
MPKGKKGKKKGKKDVPAGPTPVTTVQIIQDRAKMFCPRMGDIYDRNEQVELILEVKILTLFLRYK